jgi:hypothetical protein
MERDGYALRLWNPKTGSWISTLQEAKDRAEQTRRQADQARRQVEQENVRLK